MKKKKPPKQRSMNDAILRIFLTFVVLFALLVGFTSNWTIFDAQSVTTRKENKRPGFEQVKVKRGTIRGGDGEVLARSVERRGGAFERVYPQDDLFSHAIGYFFAFQGSASTEQFRNPVLSGERNEFESVVDQLSGAKREGDDLRVSLSPAGQRTAVDQLAGRSGAVVALDPQTGRILTMASLPAYNPNTFLEDQSELNTDEARPLLNRVTTAAYVPGSTFKVVTVSAAIDSGEFSQDDTLNGDSPKVIAGSPLVNDSDASFGDITLTEALTNSVNTVWAQVGERLGTETMFDYMERFGFFTEPRLDFPKDELWVSGVYRDGVLVEPGDDGAVDITRAAIGQGDLLVSPLQMAMVAGAVANDGVLMEPRLATKITDPDGRTVEDISPTEQDEVISSESAQTVQEMMANVVREGTGTAAALDGIAVAGKTGTAQTPDGLQAWFIGFAPVEDPKVAIAVTVEPPNGGPGGEIAAPIAGQVMRALLGG